MALEYISFIESQSLRPVWCADPFQEASREPASLMRLKKSKPGGEILEMVGKMELRVEEMFVMQNISNRDHSPKFQFNSPPFFRTPS